MKWRSFDEKHPLEQWGSMVASKKGRLLALAFGAISSCILICLATNQ